MEQAAYNESRQVSGPLKAMTHAPAMQETEYASYLEEQGIPYSLATPYLISGSPADFDNWVINISIIPQQFASHIRPVLEFLTSEDLSFAIPADAMQHSNILGGACGLDIPESLINSFRKRVQGVPLHFDHAIFLN